MRTHLLGIDIDRRSRRRILVVMLYVAYGLMITCFRFAGPGGVALAFTVLLLPVAIVLVASFWALSQVALPYSAEGAGVKLPPLDERQIQVRDRAFYRAYQVISSLFGLWIVYETIARTNERQWFWVPSTFDEYQAIVWGYLLVAATLPSSIIAWTEPDPAEPEIDASELRLAR